MPKKRIFNFIAILFMLSSTVYIIFLCTNGKENEADSYNMGYLLYSIGLMAYGLGYVFGKPPEHPEN